MVRRILILIEQRAAASAGVAVRHQLHRAGSRLVSNLTFRRGEPGVAVVNRTVAIHDGERFAVLRHGEFIQHRKLRGLLLLFRRDHIPVALGQTVLSFTCDSGLNRVKILGLRPRFLGGDHD